MIKEYRRRLIGVRIIVDIIYSFMKSIKKKKKKKRAMVVEGILV